jgi:hypothetical protein
MNFFFPFLLFLFPAISFSANVELSGNIEGQWRQTKNNSSAQEELFQNWDKSDFYLAYGNLNSKISMGDSFLEANWFVRYSQSNLYQPDPYGPPGAQSQEPFIATSIFTFPNKLVARDILQLQSYNRSGNHLTESVLNKIYYEWDYEEHRFMLGRMYVNYGLGEIFNPINPFNQPTALTSVAQIAQGNDGASFTFFVNDVHVIQFLLLGDKAIEGHNGQISKTLWAHGEYQVSDQLQIDYVLGEDQNRKKGGGQISYQFESSLIFTQVLYRSENVKKNIPSENLWDLLFGYDQQLHSKWHLRVEAGYQKRDRTIISNNFERFLPTEYFIAMANIVEVHPLVKIQGTLINDIKSGFSYMIIKSTYDFWENMEVEAFGFTPISKGDEADFEAQKLVTTDIGLALRAFF